MPAERGRNSGVGVVGGQFVARNLLFLETVVRLVRIERPNDIVAIAPGIWPHLVALKALAVRVPRQIQPMARPPLPIPRTCQQPIHNLLERARRGVGYKGGDL